MKIVNTQAYKTITVALLVALSGCGGGGSGSSAPVVAPTPTPTPTPTPVPVPTPSTTLSGVVADGYISGATVYLDANNNGLQDAGEASTTTDSAGRFSLAPAASVTQLAGAHLRISGGTDTSTSQPFTSTMSAIVEDAANKPFLPITPLSSLTDAMVSSGAAATIMQAREALVRVIGASSVSVLDKDPLTQAGSEPALLQKMVAMEKALEVLAAADRDASDKPLGAASMQRVSSALGAEIVRQAAAQGTGSAALSSVASLIAGAVERQAKFFAHPAAIRDTVALATDVANLTEASVAIGLSAILQVTPNSSGAALSSALAAQVDSRLSAIAKLQRDTIAAATAIGTTPPAAGTPALRLGDVAITSGADVSTQALVQAAKSLGAIPSASAVPSAELLALQNTMAPVPTPTPPPTPTPAPVPELPSVAVQLDQTPGTALAPAAWNAAASKVTYNDDAGIASFAAISNFGADDAIVFAGIAQSQVAVSSQGSNVTLTVNSGGAVSSIVLSNVITAGQVVYDVASFNALPVGDIRFGGVQLAQSRVLDALGGTLVSAATIDVSNGSYTLTDDALLPSVVRITGFGANDTLQWLHTSASLVAVSSKGTDVTFVVNQAGAVSSVTIVGVIPAGALVFDVGSFNALGVGKVQF